jgi:Spy/CpxP family protein refolding chaperone
MIRIGAFLVAGSLLTALPAHAQSHSHGAQGHGGEHAGMAAHHDDAAHRHAPKKLLAHGEMLKLTATQVERLEALQARHHGDCMARMEQVKAAEAAAEAALLQTTPDLHTFEAKLREAANLKVDCKVDMARTGQEALAVLTPEQRAQLAHMNHGGH